MDEMIQGKAVRRSLARENAKSDPKLFFWQTELRFLDG